MFFSNEMSLLDAFAKKAIAQRVPTDKQTLDLYHKEEDNSYINSWETKFKFKGFIGGSKCHKDSTQDKVKKLYFSLDPVTKLEINNFVRLRFQN